MESSSIFKPYQDYHNVRGDKQIMIKNSIGRQLPYIVNFQKSTCQIFDIELERVTHAFVFPDSCQLIDADYFPTADGKFGIIIGVEDKEKVWGSTNFILGLATNTDSPTMRVTHSLDLPERITVVKTLYSNDNMTDSKSLGLFPKLRNWEHIVAIGCKTCKCFLTQLTPVNVDSEVPVIHPAKKNVLDLLASFVEDDIFMYALEDGAYRDYAVSSVYVSSLALMPRSRSLLVGLSMGGIIAASLNSSNQMQMLELRHERVVHALAPLEPEDDPDKFEYFIAAINRSPRHPIMLQLWRGAFSKEQCPDEEKYDRPSFSACLEHKIMFGDRWLSVKTIVQERSLDAGLRRRNDSSMDSTLLNSSQLFGCTFNRSNVFLAYARQQGGADKSFEVEAAIFDIDAWYYKRVPGKVQFDSTALRQCPFMSCIKSQIDSNQVTDIGILTLDSTNMYRFNSMISDADQLFYPSAVFYERVFVAFQTNISWMKIQNVQETILQKCASKLPWIVRSPDPMATNIIAAGLVRQNVLTGSPNTSATEDVPDVEKEREKPKLVSNLAPNLRVVLHSMIYYGRIGEFCALITRNDLSDKIKVEIAEWAILEAIEYKKTIADRIVALFQGSTAALSPLAEDTLQQGIKMFRIVHEYLRGCSKCVTEKRAEIKSYAMSAKCMLNHTKLVHHFVIFRIVPVNHSIEMLMRQQHEKRKNTALKNRTALPIQMTTRNMQRLAPIAQFWNHLPHDEWYPPTPLDLLESILNVSITERLKRDLIVQFVLDWIRANPENSEYTDSQLAMEVIKTMSAQMLDVDLEKIYYILEQEKAALTKPAAAAPVEEASASKKVFSLDKDGLTYEQLWSDKVHLGWTIKPADLERFKQRMKAQEEDAEYKKKLFDPETEMFYQAFLCQNQKYHLMSTEAIESNKLLLSFYPNLLRDRARQLQKPVQVKSAKEREVEKSVKEMFEKQHKRDMEEVPEVYAKMGEQEGVAAAGGAGGRKRRSEVFEGRESVSPMSFVPPTAKRIQQRGATPPPVDDETIELDEGEKKTSNDINAMIATPSRYYKRPVPVDLSSPTHLQKAPPVHHTNSILKTAKTIQSPGRGRIRFHASVRKGANESADEEPIEEENVTPEGGVGTPKINFAILEDDEEEEPTYLRRSSSKTFEANTPVPEDATPAFEVLEDKDEQIEETTFEIQDDDDDDANFKSLEENATYEEPEEQKEVVEEYHEESQKTAEIQMELDSESNETEAPEEATNTEATDDFQEPEWDGIERSFEKQKDEDCEPAVLEDPVFAVPKNPDVEKTSEEDTEDVEAPEDAETQDDDLAQDVPLDRTFEVQEEEEGPKPRGDTPIEEPSATFVVEEPKVVKQGGRKKTPSPQLETMERKNPVDEELERPPSANTRSSSRIASSRSVTPVEELATKPKKPQVIERSTEVQEEAEESTKKKPASKKSSKASTPDVTEDIPEVPVEVERPASRTRRAAQKPSESVEAPKEEEEPPKRPVSRSRTTRAKPSEDVQTESEPPKRPASRTRATRANSKTPEDAETTTIVRKTPEATIPEVQEDRPASRTRRAASVKKDPKPESSTPTRRRSRSRTTSEVVVPAPDPEDVPKPTPRGRGRPSRATTPSRNDNDVANTTATTKATRGRKAASERPVTPTNVAEEDLNTTGASIKRRMSTRTVLRATSVQPGSTPAPVTASAKRATRGAAVASAPTTPGRGRKPKAVSESDATVVVPSSGTRGGATKRRNTPEEPSTSATSSEPAKKSAKGAQGARSRATPLRSIPEVEETPKRGRSRTTSTSSNGSTVPTTPKRGRKAAAPALDVVEEEIQEEEEEAPPQPEVRRSARRLQQQKQAPK